MSNYCKIFLFSLIIQYNYIIPVSGGRDSTFQAYVMKETFGFNPLAVAFHPLDQTDIGRKNLDNLKKLGVDCIEFSTKPDVYLKMARFGLTELGDFRIISFLLNSISLY